MMQMQDENSFIPFTSCPLGCGKRVPSSGCYLINQDGHCLAYPSPLIVPAVYDLSRTLLSIAYLNVIMLVNNALYYFQLPPSSF
jgi:hypothetical protein